MPTSVLLQGAVGDPRAALAGTHRLVCLRGSGTAVELGVDQALVGALLLTAAPAGLHPAAPAVRGLHLVLERVTGAFGGRVAVCYVILHLLPEVAGGEAELPASCWGRRWHRRR